MSRSNNRAGRACEVLRVRYFGGLVACVASTADKPINTAAFPSNWELSLVRASHVARYLMKSGGIAPSRFVVMGRGEYEPTAANADDESRALNRRVEIIITRDEHKGKERNRQ